MISKILFLTFFPFNQRDFKRFGIELLQENGFKVEVWDLTIILSPHLVRNYTLPDPINWSAHKVFKDKTYALNRLKDLSSEVFIISWLPYNRKLYSIYGAISRSDAKYAFSLANAQPPAKNEKLKELCL